MRTSRTVRVFVLAAFAVGLLATAAPASAARPADAGVSGPAQASAVRSCPAPPSGFASCFALVRTDGKPPGSGKGKPPPSPPPPTSGPTSGLFPADLQSAYNLPSSTAGGGTVAIIDAYDDPNAEADLGVYRSQFNLPPCTTANGCFRKVNQNGGTSYPRANGGWAQEISLDLDMVSAICPNCKILLVEAKSASFADLGAAVTYAASVSGVVAISNSYGGSDASDANYGQYYDWPRIAVTVSSGDNGYGVQYPASSTYVTAVGGTTLPYTKSSPTALATFGTETVWSGAGSGCSAYNVKPSWQTDTGCGNRTVADVAAVADPNTGVAVYDSYSYQGLSGWLVFGGTSVASPIIASVYALAGNAASVPYPSSLPYAATSGLNDVSSGSNGSCTPAYLCTGEVGYDGPTGLGTPNGTGAF